MVLSQNRVKSIIKLGFEANIVGVELHCEIVTDIALSGAIFCFSIYTPGKVVSGGTLVGQVAGYTEVALPDLKAGVVNRPCRDEV